MKFREYGEVVPLTVTASTPRGLDMAIESIGQKRDVIDLQLLFGARQKNSTLMGW